MSLEKAQHELARNGICGGKQDIFFSTERADWAEAKSLCRKCPVQDLCLSYALGMGEVFGVWGGADQRELREALGVDANSNPHPWPTLRCPSCRTGETTRDDSNPKPSVRRGWIVVRRQCTECKLVWNREEPKKLPKKKVKK